MAKTIPIADLSKWVSQISTEFSQKFAAEAASRVVDLTPVLTGGLRGSIGVYDTPATDNSGVKDESGGSTKSKIESQSARLKGDAYVTAGADYSEQVEFGTASRAARPFMRPVVAQAQDIANKISKEL